MSLDERKQSILRAVIVEYVTSAEPIGSELIAQKYTLGVKSATVRNEMAALSDSGYLEQPHTSAGRIPSDQGYRYFVDRLAVPHLLQDSETSRLRQKSKDGEVLTSLLRDTAHALANLTHLLSIATVHRSAAVQIRGAVLSALSPSQAMFTLVLSNGHVENRMLALPSGITLEDLGRVNEFASSTIVGVTLRQAAALKFAEQGRPAVDKLLSQVWSQLRIVVKDLTRGSIIAEGKEYILAQPEFARESGAMVDVMEWLNESDSIYEALSGDHSLTVRIGRENKNQKMHQLSVVRQAFYVGQDEAGVIALVGPKRMRYERSMPLIKFTAAALTDSLNKFLG